MRRNLLFALALVAACAPGGERPAAIAYGEANCDFCHMTLERERHAAQIVPATGTVKVFDEAGCLMRYVAMAEGRIGERHESAGGILFFAAPMSDKARSTQVVHKGLQAIAGGGKLRIEYDPADQSGAAWGCLAHDCRPALSIQPHDKGEGPGTKKQP